MKYKLIFSGVELVADVPQGVPQPPQNVYGFQPTFEGYGGYSAVPTPTPYMVPYQVPYQVPDKVPTPWPQSTPPVAPPLPMGSKHDKGTDRGKRPHDAVWPSAVPVEEKPKMTKEEHHKAALEYLKVFKGEVEKMRGQGVDPAEITEKAKAVAELKYHEHVVSHHIDAMEKASK